MFDTCPASPIAFHAASPAPDNAAAQRRRSGGIVGAYRGPERRAGAAFWPLLIAMLDEVDYGMLLLGEDARVLHANHAVRGELDDDNPLQLLDGRLRARRPQDAAALRSALLDVQQRGWRMLVRLGDGRQAADVAVVPLPGAGPATLLMFGKRQVCEALSVHWFARSRGLTPAESEVLKLLCLGHEPAAIAARQQVAISTIRTQIGSIRAKTGVASIRELVQRVAVLPPVLGALRQAA